MECLREISTGAKFIVECGLLELGEGSLDLYCMVAMLCVLLVIAYGRP